MGMSKLDWVSFILVIIGGLNWGLVGAFKYDLVASLLGGMDGIGARIVYGLVGLAALYALVTVGKHKGDGAVVTATPTATPTA